uniref:DUF5648 domain-containing protein n=2 Tax=Clytia hemisphaerica TaxID=252671 RepID=A0A7M5WJ62_9CNID
GNCVKEPGFCVQPNGCDQNSGVIKMNSFEGNTQQRQQECLKKCLAHPGATGCEVIWHQSNRGCYIHTQSVARGNNAARHSCWVFSKCKQAPLYRFWNRRLGDHFYTTNYNEIWNGKRGSGFKGIQCRVLKHHQDGTIPLYRYWRRYWSDHFYTTNIREIGTARRGQRGRYGYVSEGITAYCYPSSRQGLIPLYRYWKASIVDHFYTTNIREIGTSVRGKYGHHGYKSEGIVCYVFPA